jgi:DNA-binding transcriptional regulator YiaG
VAKLETVIKETITRGARRQVRLMVLPLRREVVRLRRKLAEVHSGLLSIRRRAVSWERLLDATPPGSRVSEEDVKAARLSPRLIQRLRKRLGLSQTALARLLSVSGPAVAQWEAGRSKPRGQHRAALVSLRKVGKREAKELLARQTKEPRRKEPRRSRPARPAKRRRRAKSRPARRHRAPSSRRRAKK